MPMNAQVPMRFYVSNYKGMISSQVAFHITTNATPPAKLHLRCVVALDRCEYLDSFVEDEASRRQSRDKTSQGSTNHYMTQ